MRKKERTLLLVFLVAILMAGSVYLYGGKRGQEVAVPREQTGVATTSEPRTQEQQQEIRVHVKGEVNQPGVYQIPADSRVIDAIQAAGGSKAGADLEQLNLAAVVADGSEVIVPTTGATTEAEAKPANTSGKINLNTATIEELDKLPGIGSVRAQAIIEYRQEHGRFLQIDDLKQVPGIGVKMFDQIRDKVTVN